MTDKRSIGKEALTTVTSSVTNIENIIWKQTGDDEIAYNDLIYQAVGDIIEQKSSKLITSGIRNGKTGWEHPCFDEPRLQLDEQDNFIEHPFEVAEGVLTCTRQLKDGTICNSKRVFYYQIQTRSSDEPMTTFATCCSCGNNWSYSG